MSEYKCNGKKQIISKIGKAVLIVNSISLQESRCQSDHVFPRSRRLIQPSRKCNCPAKIKIRRIIKFPDFKVNVILVL